MRALLFGAFFASLVICRLREYTVSISTSNSTAAISNYNADLASCICDVNTGFCDMFCCCDSQCSSASVTKWTNALACLPSSSDHLI